MRRWGIALGLIVALAVGYVLCVMAATGRTGNKASVTFGSRTVDVSGMRSAAARDAVAQLDDELGHPVSFSVGGSTGELVPASSGFRLDPSAVATQLTQRTWNPVVVFQKLLGKHHVTAKPVVDQGVLASSITRATASLISPKPVEGAVRIAGGKPVVTTARNGVVVKPAESAAAMADGWDRPPVALVADVTQPAITQAAVNQALSSTVRPALSAPLTVVVGKTRVVVPVARFAPALTMKSVGHQLQPALEPSKLKAAVVASSPAIAAKPVNARIEFQGSKPVVVPSKNGVTIDEKTLAAKAFPAMRKSGAARTVTLAAKTVTPAVTTAQLTALKINQLVSDFSIHCPDNPPRTHNIATAAAVVNGTLLKPGETFSLNGTLGQRTAAAGYRKAPVIEGGQLVEGYGGGVSQVATTLFNGMFFAGLQDVEHHPHTMYFSRYPEGREATLAWGQWDLRFRNDSGHGIYIRMWLANQAVHVQFWGTRVWQIESAKSPRRNLLQPRTKTSDNPRCVPQTTPSEGFDVTVTRIFKRGGRVVKTERFWTHYDPEDKITCTRNP